MDQASMRDAVRTNDLNEINTNLKLLNKPSFHDFFTWVDFTVHERTIAFIIHELRKMGADINEIRGSGTLLARAAIHNNFTVGRLLLGAGADINCSAGIHSSPLSRCIEHCRYDYAIFLMQNGARFNSNTLPDYYVNMAICHKDPMMLALVLDLIKGASLTFEWETHFLQTIEDGKEPCAVVFVEKGYLSSKDAAFQKEAFDKAAKGGYIKLKHELVKCRDK